MFHSTLHLTLLFSHITITIDNTTDTDYPLIPSPDTFHPMNVMNCLPLSITASNC